MKSFRKYIDQKYSNELKLLIFLSQDKLTDDSHPIDPNQIDWNDFIDLVLKHRLTSHILKHSTFLAEKFPIPTYEKLIDIRLEQSKRSLNFAVHAIRIYQKFKENNINHCFFKGPLLSLELYKDIGYRNFGDIDILVDKDNIEKAKVIIEELDFKCIYPQIELTEKQKKINYSISHHYHFTHPVQAIDIELHWSISNPKSYFGIETSDIISKTRLQKVSHFDLSYISEAENLVYLAAHGAIHQWYRLFWLKDFSVLLAKTKPEDLKKAWELSIKLKLQNSFWQACQLSNLIYNAEIPDFLYNIIKNKSFIYSPLKSIHVNELKQQGLKGKFQFVLYRLKLKPSLKYSIDLIYRLRTHLSDWEKLKLPNHLFFLYYILRPILFFFKTKPRWIEKS